MITVSLILTIILVAIVMYILYQIIGTVATKLGLDPVWVRVIWLVLLLVVVIWVFSLFGITQPIVR